MGHVCRGALTEFVLIVVGTACKDLADQGMILDMTLSHLEVGDFIFYQYFIAYHAFETGGLLTYAIIVLVEVTDTFRMSSTTILKECEALETEACCLGGYCVNSTSGAQLLRESVHGRGSHVFVLREQNVSALFENRILCPSDVEFAGKVLSHRHLLFKLQVWATLPELLDKVCVLVHAVGEANKSA